MKEFWKNLNKWQKGGILLGILGSIVILIVVSVMATKTGPNVRIKFSVDNNIPGSEMQEIRQKLVYTIKDNTKNFSNSTVYEGTARDYNESFGDESITVNFVVDFDEIRQSYAVMAMWSRPDNENINVVISCPLLNTKYPETPCITETNSSSELVNYLPYTGKASDGNEYILSSKYDGEKMHLEIKTDGDGEAAALSAKKWIKEIGFNPDDYLFYVQNGKYVQVNHAKTNDANVNEKLPYFLPNAFNVYPVVDESGNVKSIRAEISGCTNYQTDPVEEDIREYLEKNAITYPVEFEYCTD